MLARFSILQMSCDACPAERCPFSRTGSSPAPPGSAGRFHRAKATVGICEKPFSALRLLRSRGFFRRSIDAHSRGAWKRMLRPSISTRSDEAQATSCPLEAAAIRSRPAAFQRRRGSRISSFFEEPRWLLSLLRRFWPNVRVGRFLLVTRNNEVRDILERSDEFQTPYGPEMAESPAVANFILGMQDGADYRRMKSVVLSAFPPGRGRARGQADRRAPFAAIIVVARSPGFDAISGLLKIVPVAHLPRLFRRSSSTTRLKFAEWSIALSALFFSDPFGNTATREVADVAADRMVRGDRPLHRGCEGRQDHPDTPHWRGWSRMLDRRAADRSRRSTRS